VAAKGPVVRNPEYTELYKNVNYIEYLNNMAWGFEMDVKLRWSLMACLAGHFLGGRIVCRPALLLVCLAVAAPGWSDPRVEGIDALVTEAMTRAGVPGMQVAVRHGDQLRLILGRGVADFEHDLPVTADTVFAIGSITKQVTALAIAQLVVDGRLDLDDRVGSHLPELADRSVAEATLKQLLTHQSGLLNYTDLPELHKRAWHPHGHAEMLDWFVDGPLEFPPGQRWRYTNSGTYLLGMVVEAVAGKSYAEYLQQHVFDPLAMADTAYADSKLIVPGRARGYDAGPDGGLRHARGYDASVPFAAGALVSTGRDLLAYASAVLGGAGIGEDLHRLIVTAGELDDGTRLAYTLGSFFATSFEGRRKFSHGGQIYGYSAQLAHYPDDDLTVVILSNRHEYQPAAVSLERRIARILLGVPQPGIAPAAAPPALLAAVSGGYTTLPLSFFGLDRLQIWASEGRLLLSFGPERNEAQALLFRYVGDGRFVAEVDEEISLRWHAREVMLEYYDLRMPLAPITAGATDSVCARARSRLEALRDQHGFPGAVMAIRSLEGRDCRFAVGTADRELGRPMLPGDRMLAASIGKTFVGATVLDLAARGILGLDDRVSDWLADLPGYERLPNAAEMTIRHLLTHTSGLADHIHDERFLADWRQRMTQGQHYFEPAEVLAYLHDTPPLFPVGATFAYTDTGYILLGLVIERAAGQSFYSLVQTRFLSPIGLSQTTPSDRRRLTGLVQGYAGANRARVEPFSTLDEQGLLRWHPLTEWTGGGFMSNARDLARWVLVHFSGNSMDHDYLPELLRGIPAEARAAGSSYGMGASTLDTPWGPLIGHTGWVPGYRSTAFFLPEQGTAYALQVNTDIGLAGEGNPFLEINLALLEAMFGEGAGDD